MKSLRSFWIGALTLALTVSPSVAQGDVFNSGSSSRCQTAREAENRRHDSVWAELTKERIEAGGQRERDIIECRDNQGCRERVARQYGDRERQIQAKAETEIARHSRAIADIDAGRCAPGTPGQPGPGRDQSPNPFPAGRAPGNNPGAGRSPDSPNTGNRPAPAPGQPTPSNSEMPLPPDLRRQLLEGAAEMDRLATGAQAYALAGTNRFFKCLTDAIAADLRFLAQPAYVPAAQMAKALHENTWRYLTSNAYDNNRQLFQNALQDLKRLKNDPACALADIAPAAAAAVATHTVRAAAAATEAQAAANRAVQIANAHESRRKSWGAPARNRFNPECAPNMCYPSAVAQELAWATGDPHFALTFSGNVEIQIFKGVPTRVHNLTHDLTVRSMNASLFGSKALQGRPLASARLANQMRGIPSPSRSGLSTDPPWTLDEIVDEMTDAKPGARGLVFLSYPPSPENPYGIGHVVNVRNHLGKIEILDPSNSNIDGRIFFEGATASLYRTN